MIVPRKNVHKIYNFTKKKKLTEFTVVTYFNIGLLDTNILPVKILQDKKNAPYSSLLRKFSLGQKSTDSKDSEIYVFEPKVLRIN